MTPSMIAALTSGRFIATALFEFDLPSGTRRLMLGSGECMWGGDTFVGHDDNFGFVDSGEDVRESADGIAPNSSITIIPAAAANRSLIAAPGVQLSPIKTWLACLQLDASDNIIVVPDPELLFEGFIDQATVTMDEGRDEIDYSIISAFDYFFEDTEGQRLNGAYHQYIWPGEKGLDNVTGVTRKVYWGMNDPPGTRSGTSSIWGRGQVIGRVLSGWAGS